MSKLAVAATAIALETAMLLKASSAVGQGWQLIEPMPTARIYHAAAAAGNRWYVGGGETPADFPSEVDVFEGPSGHWVRLGNLTQGRKYLPAGVDLARGRVLFPGGFLPAGSFAYLPLATCDVAASQGVSPAPDLLEARHLHAVAFAAGKFIVSGGRGDGSGGEQLRDDAEMWDGAAAMWMAAGKMPAGRRAGHTMTTLQNGREILTVGGGLPDRAMNEVDVFDAGCSAWSRAAPLRVARVRHKALLLADGRVLVVGGFTYPPTANNVQNSAELFNPTTGKWKDAASMTDPRFDFDMVLLPDGRVLVAGGSNNATDANVGALSSAEVYDPAADTWTVLPPMNERRLWPVVAALSDGVYVAGGMNTSTVLASVERLAWSDLGITGPIDLDAGVPGESPPDAAASCNSDDAGVSTDAGQPADGAVDVSRSDAAIDTSPLDGGASDRETGAGKSGCACTLNDAADDPEIGLALISVALGAVLRRRSLVRRRGAAAHLGARSAT